MTGGEISLNPDQFAFTLDIAKLIIWVYEHPGWTMTGGEWKRPQQMADLYAEAGIGIKDSLHISRLAWDGMLFIDGAYKTDLESYRPLGEYWELLDARNRWGGHFKTKPDPDHFERRPV